MVWYSEEVSSEEGSMNITIPREEFDVPSVGSEYFWKVRRWLL